MMAAFYRILQCGGIAILLAFSPFRPLLGQPPDVKVAIIVNPEVTVTEMSSDDLKLIFLGVKTSLRDGSHLQPVLRKGGAAHAVFLKQYIARSDSALQTYYRSLVFAGKWSMPVSLASDAEVVRYVERTRGAIGYINSNSVVDSVKTLGIN